MNKLLLTMGIVMLPLVAFAFNDKDVRFTVHNLAYNTDVNKGLLNADIGFERNYSANNPNMTQVCVFCHTPHNATPAIPLWNKVYDPTTAATYRLYTSSATLTSTTKRATITATSPSMLCLSCHDGKTAMNVLHNSSVRDATNAQGDAVIYFNGGLAGPQALGDVAFSGMTYPSDLGATRNPDGTVLNATAGTNLTDDHPIGFSYDKAVADDGGSGLRSTATAKTNQVRFFGSTNTVECSSCHDPHVFYGYVKQGGSRVPIDMTGRTTAAPTATQQARTPFLVRDNNGSALCLSCHIK